MTANFRKALAWLRGRWHADLEFQHGSQRDALLERLQLIVAGLEGQASRLEQLDLRLAAIESRTETLHAEQAARIGHWQEQAFVASRDMATVVQSTAGELQVALQTSAEDVRHRLAAISRETSEQFGALAASEPRLREAVVEVVRAVRDSDARREEHAANAARQVSELAAIVAALGQSVHITAQSTPAISQEVREDRQSTVEWFSRIEQTLQRNVAEEREQTAREEQLRRDEAAAAARRSMLTADDLAAIERQGVFVVGSARSGTTILRDCLNVSRDVYMLQEACFFCSDLAANYVGWDKYDFAAAFNERHASSGSPRDKGTYVPTADRPDRTPLEFVNRLRSKYRYVGEKLAFVPEPHYMDENWESRFLAYHARYFYHSQYFITIRAPQEALWSMHKMFPDRPIAGLFEAWLRSLRTVLELYLAFPNTYLLVMEWLDERLIGRIADVLQTEIPLPKGMVGRHFQHSTRIGDELVPVLRPYRAWHDECATFYSEVRDGFSPETMQFTDAGHQRHFVNTLGKRATALLDEVMRSMRTRTLAMRRAA